MLILIQLILICKAAMLSQLPLREALAHLTAEGLVQTIDHRGYQVAPASAAVSGPSSPRQKGSRRTQGHLRSGHGAQ
jgi:DNA-binding GntR family transcriptional regulator